MPHVEKMPDATEPNVKVMSNERLTTVRLPPSEATRPYSLPYLSIDKLLKTATPLLGVTVVSPDSVQPLGFRSNAIVFGADSPV